MLDARVVTTCRAGVQMQMLYDAHTESGTAARYSELPGQRGGADGVAEPDRDEGRLAHEDRG